MIITSFPINTEGQRIQFQVHSETVNDDFFMTLMMIDFEELGRLAD